MHLHLQTDAVTHASVKTAARTEGGGEGQGGGVSGVKGEQWSHLPSEEQRGDVWRPNTGTMS